MNFRANTVEEIVTFLNEAKKQIEVLHFKIDFLMTTKQWRIKINL